MHKNRISLSLTKIRVNFHNPYTSSLHRPNSFLKYATFLPRHLIILSGDNWRRGFMT
jgi:hypothetical protein